MPYIVDVEARACRDVVERAVAGVAKELGAAAPTRLAGPVGAVDQKHVLPAVVVEVDKRRAGAERLGQVLLPERAVVVGEATPAAAVTSVEADRWRRLARAGPWHDGHHAGAAIAKAEEQR